VKSDIWSFYHRSRT